MIFSLASIFLANAQTSDSPWAVSLGANLVSVQDDSVDAGMSLGIPSCGGGSGADVPVT